MDTDQERIKFISENTFINGESLVSVVPDIETFLAEYKAQSNKVDFNFDSLRIPVTMESRKVQGYWDKDGNYVPNDDIYYDNQAIAEELRESISDALISYGYDPQVAREWLREKDASWKQIQEAADNSKVAEAKADVADAADHIKTMLDDMVSDIRAR